MRSLPAENRIEEMIAINLELSASSSKKKRKLPVSAEDSLDTDEELRGPAKKARLDESLAGGEVRGGGGATRRQQDVKLRQVEKEKKEKEKGPAWYYEVVGVKKPR